MNRRTYLAVASGICLGGCLDRSGADGDESGNGTGTVGRVDRYDHIEGRTGGSGSTDRSSDNRTNDEPADEPKDDEPDEEERREGVPTGTLEDFEDLSRWRIDGDELVADTDRALIGTQSARLEITGRDHSTRLSMELPEPVDCSDVVPGLAVASEDTVVVPWFRLFDTEGNRIDYRRSVSPGLPLQRYGFGVDEFDDGVDLTSIAAVEVAVWTGSGQERTVWLDDLHLLPRPDTGTVMIQFDDGHVTDYTEALPILDEHGYPAVTFVNPGYIDEGDIGGARRLTTDQLHELHDAGWCIGNHTTDHVRLSERSAAEQRTQIRESQEWLRAEGFETGARYFAYPFGDYDATTIELVDEFHGIGYAGGCFAHGFTPNTRLAPRISEPSAAEARRILDLTAEVRGFTTIFYHGLRGELLSDFEAMVSHLHELESAGELEVVLPPDHEREYLF